MYQFNWFPNETQKQLVTFQYNLMLRVGISIYRMITHNNQLPLWGFLLPQPQQEKQLAFGGFAIEQTH